MRVVYLPLQPQLRLPSSTTSQCSHQQNATLLQTSLATASSWQTQTHAGEQSRQCNRIASTNIVLGSFCKTGNCLFFLSFLRLCPCAKIQATTMTMPAGHSGLRSQCQHRVDINLVLLKFFLQLVLLKSWRI